MATNGGSKRAGGRPRLPWTSSRKWKLARLYLMTDLSITEIRLVLAADGFALGSRNIQTQLKYLLPDNSMEWRRYRPVGVQQMGLRLSHIKQCKEYYIAKYSRKSPPLKLGPTLRCSAEVNSTQLTPYYNPFRHYDRLPSSMSSHVTLPRIEGVNRESAAAESTLRREGERDEPYSGEEVALRTEQVAEGSSEVSGPVFVDKEDVPEVSNPPKTASGELNTDSPDEGIFDAPVRGLKRSYSKLSITSSGSSVGHLSIRLSSRMSQSLRHVKDELRTWDELVDESGFTSRPLQHRDYGKASLYNRSCCHFFVEDSDAGQCIACGFSETHYLVRSARLSYSAIDADAPLDRFGNTPLHHAAAAGNSTAVIQLMAFAESQSLQNTSGETYLHVFRLDEGSQLSLYLEILEKASKLEFDFNLEGFRGNNVAEIFLENVQKWHSLSDPSTTDQILDVFRSQELKFSSAGIKSPPLENIAEETTEQFLENFPRAATQWTCLRDGNPHGSLLLTTLENWPTNPKSPPEMKNLARTSRINMRNEQGYTALALAARHGLRDVVVHLPYHGANANSRSYQGTSVLAHAGRHLQRAHKTRDDRLYAGIVSSMVVLADHGAKPKTSVYDEYSVFIPSHRQNQQRGQANTHVLVVEAFSTNADVSVEVPSAKRQTPIYPAANPSHIPPKPSEDWVPTSPSIAPGHESQTEGISCFDSYKPVYSGEIASEPRDCEISLKDMRNSAPTGCSTSIPKKPSKHRRYSDSCTDGDTTFATRIISESNNCETRLKSASGSIPMECPNSSNDDWFSTSLHESTPDDLETDFEPEGRNNLDTINIGHDSPLTHMHPEAKCTQTSSTGTTLQDYPIKGGQQERRTCCERCLSNANVHPADDPNMSGRHYPPSTSSDQRAEIHVVSWPILQTCSCPVHFIPPVAHWRGLENRTFRNYTSSALKFFSWLAYTLKDTSSTISAENRRTCPLLFCRN